MARLTIIIPYLGNSEIGGTPRDAEHLEETLVSVLENRPPRCELILVHDGSYSDPYDLTDELQLIADPSARSNSELINSALQVCESEVAHILLPGTVVSDGWTRGIVERFADPRLGSIAPLVVAKDDPKKIITLGVRYGRGGTRRSVGAGRMVGARSRYQVGIHGPSLMAGFYRVDPVLDVGGFELSVGDELADIDLGMTLRSLGYRSEFVGDCQLAADQESGFASGFKTGRRRQRLFWRHARQSGLLRSLIVHPFSVLANMVGDIPHPGSITQLAGRLMAFTDWPSYGRYHAVLEAIRNSELASVSIQGSTTVDPQPLTSGRKAA